MQATSTDNVLNFVDVFHMLNVRLPATQDLEAQDNEAQDRAQVYNQFWDNSDASFDGALQAEEALVFYTPFNASNVVGINNSIKLVNQIQCPSQQLGLAATSDTAEILNTSLPFTDHLHSTMGKCSSLWVQTGHSNLNETAKYKLDEMLKFPSPYKWTSLYEAIKSILANRHKINDLMHALYLIAFDERDFEFLKEYVHVLEPLVAASEQLSGVEGCFLGDLIPTILVTESKLNDLIRQNCLKYCSPLLHSVCHAFKMRFGKYLLLEHEANESILAAISHPFFKLRWLSLKKDSTVPYNVMSERFRQLFIDAVRLCHNESSIGGQNSNCNNTIPNSCSVASNSNFFFSNTEMKKPEVMSIENQVNNYLADPGTKIKTLEAFPAIKKVFLRYNTIFPSSTVVSKIFPFQDLCSTPNRLRMSDKLLEKYLLLKANNWLESSQNKIFTST